MKFVIYIWFFVFLCSAFVSGQVSIGPDDLLGLIGKTGTVEEDTSGFINVSPGPAGENQTWNFSTTQISPETSFIEFLLPQNTCCADSFPTANFANLQYFAGESSDSVYGYFEVTSSSIYFFGIAGKEADSSTIVYLDEDITPLPLNFGANWTSVSIDTFFGGVFAVIFKDSTYTEVDAWGSVTVPAGTFETLRLRDNNTSYQFSYFDGNLVSADTSTSFSYEWISENNFIVASMESQYDETNPNFNIASYMSRLKTSSITSIEQYSDSKNPKAFELFQNYPNPFNPETAIAFYLSQNDKVRVDIFDLNGKLVTTLIDENKTAGNHKVIWHGENANGLNVASGIYYYILSVNGKGIKSKKMVLIR